VKITEVQRKVLHDLLREGRLASPRGSLERLAKKGLVEGGRRDGWTLTEKGLRWLQGSVK
jgi:Mn-dependent DtxR family transcriptional regulator